MANLVAPDTSDKIEETISSHKSYPISTLPNKILGKILLESTGPRGCSVRTLAKVSRQWYQVALDTSSLWGDITISSSRSDWLKPYLDRSEPRRETCTTITELEQTLSRSKSSYLYIQIDCSTWGDTDFRVPGRTQLFRRLFSTKITSQMKHLTLFVNGIMIPEDLVDWSQCNFSSLYKLSCSDWFPCADQFLQSIDRTAQNLKEVHFTHMPHMPLNNSWPNLKRLHCGTANEIPADSILLRCRSLEFLSTEKINWPTQRTPPILFSDLDRIILYCGTLVYLTRLQLPRLSELFLTHNLYQGNEHPANAIPEASNVTVDLPELTFLHLTASAAWLASFHVPKLRKMIFSTPHSRPGWDTKCLNFLSTRGASSSTPLFGSLRVLFFSSSASESSIVNILPLFPVLSDLRLSSNHKNRPKDFGQFLIEKLILTSPQEKNILLPRLVKFRLGDNSSRLYLEQNVVTELTRRLFEARKESRLPLELSS